MTKDEALRLALDTLKEVREETFRLLKNGERLYAETKVWDTIYEIKKALETKNEPVAWGVFEGNLHDMFFTKEEAQEMAKLKGSHAEIRPLYTTPQRTWVGLTKEEIDQGLLRSPYALQNAGAWREGVAWTIQQLKDKNNVQ
jgi:hypothetical protein